MALCQSSVTQTVQMVRYFHTLSPPPKKKINKEKTFKKTLAFIIHKVILFGVTDALNSELYVL